MDYPLSPCPPMRYILHIHPTLFLALSSPFLPKQVEPDRFWIVVLCRNRCTNNRPRHGSPLRREKMTGE
eukprot:282160-Chlamydomonas_euryale.AAC.5